MNKNSILERSHYEDFLVCTSFRVRGPNPDYLKSCIDRAYLDFNRTLHGLIELPSRDMLSEQATKKLILEFSDLEGNHTKLIGGTPSFVCAPC